MRKLVLAMAAGSVLAAALPGSAVGAVTIGSNLDSSPAPDDEGSHGAPLYHSQRTLLATHQAAGGLTSPINGVVVRWRVKAGSGSGPIKFRVIRPGGDAFEATGAGTSSAADPPSNTTTSFALNPGLPIRANDGIGFESLEPFPAEQNYWHEEAGVGEVNFWFDSFPDGAPPRPPNAIGPDLELLLQAVIEPDKDGDRLGDETQDPDGGNRPAPATGPGPCTLLNLNLVHIRIGDLVCL